MSWAQLVFAGSLTLVGGGLTVLLWWHWLDELRGGCVGPDPGEDRAARWLALARWCGVPWDQTRGNPERN